MSVPRTRVTGPVCMPDGSPLTGNGQILFTLKSWDRTNGELVLHGPISAPVSGGEFEVDLFETTAGDRNVTYQVTYVYWSVAEARSVPMDLGVISTTGPGPLALANLLALPAAVPDVPDLLAQALAAAASAEEAAGAVVPVLEDRLAAEAAAEAAVDAAEDAEGFGSEAQSASSQAVAAAGEAVAAAALAEGAVQFDYLVDTDAARIALVGMTTGQTAYVRATEHRWTYNGSAWVDNGLAANAGMALRTQVMPVQAALAATTIIGSAAPISGANTLAGATYVLNQAIAADGYALRLRGYSTGAGTIYLKRFTLSGGVFTQTGDDVPVAVGSGLFDIDLAALGIAMRVLAGQYLGFWAGAPTIVRYTSPSALPLYSRTPFYGSGGTTNVTTVNATGEITAGRVNLQIHVGALAVTEARVAADELRSAYALAGLRNAVLDAGIYSPSLAFLEHHGAWYDLTDRTALCTDTAGLVPVRETGDLIRRIKDKSGNGYDMLTPGDSYRPAYKRKAMGRYSTVEFGSDDHLAAVKTGLTRERDVVTIFALAKWTAPSGGQCIISHSIWNATSSRIYVGQVAITSASRLGMVMRATDAAASANVLSFKYLNANYTAGEWVILEAQVDWPAGEARLWTNGENTVEGVVTFTPAALSSTENENSIWMGGVGPSTNAFIGEIAEVVELCGALAPETREGIYEYLSRKALDLALGDLEDYDPADPMEAIFFWFNAPSIIKLAGADEIYAVGGNSRGGSILVAGYDYSGSSLVTETVPLHLRLQVDDHNVPAMVQLPDGHVIAVYCGHNFSSSMYRTKTLAPGDLSAWAAPTDIGPQTIVEPGHTVVTSYNYLFRLSGESGRLYLIYREADRTIATDPPNYYTGEYWVMTWSDDDGVTWENALRLWGPNRPYTRAASNGVDRIDFLFNRSHPAISADNDLFHCYYQAGAFYKSDGTLIGAIGSVLPLDLDADPTKVYEVGSGLGNAWVWDLTYDQAGEPVGTFVTFRSSYTLRDYYQARFNGATWSVHKIAQAGAALISGQAAYTGGVITDPDDRDVVYASVQVDETGTLDTVDGVYQLLRFETADGGTTWTKALLTAGDKPAFRPIIPAGSRRLFYVTGDYGPNYTSFDTTVAVIDLDP